MSSAMTTMTPRIREYEPLRPTRSPFQRTPLLSSSNRFSTGESAMTQEAREADGTAVNPFPVADNDNDILSESSDDELPTVEDFLNASKPPSGIVSSVSTASHQEMKDTNTSVEASTAHTHGTGGSNASFDDVDEIDALSDSSGDQLPTVEDFINASKPPSGIVSSVSTTSRQEMKDTNAPVEANTAHAEDVGGDGTDLAGVASCPDDEGSAGDDERSDDEKDDIHGKRPRKRQGDEKAAAQPKDNAPSKILRGMSKPALSGVRSPLLSCAGDEYWDVKCVMGKRVRNGTTEYQIGWKPSWLPEKDMSCQDLVQAFETRKRKSSVAGGAGRCKYTKV